MNLFIDTTNWNLAILLEKDGKIIDQFIELNTRKVSDILVGEIETLLKKNQISLKEIENLYVTVGPGSYTGVRVGLLFVRTLKTIDDHYQTYVINSLLFQVGTKQAISVLDARGGKYFVGVYDQTNPLITEQLAEQSQLEAIIEEYPFPVIEDYQDLDFGKNFLLLKDHFTKVENYENLNPLYLKSSV